MFEKPSYLNSILPLAKEIWNKLVKSDDIYVYVTYDIVNTELLKRLQQKHSKFIDIIDGEIQRGISPDYAKAFVIDNKLAQIKNLEHEILKPLVLRKHISRYGKIPF